MIATSWRSALVTAGALQAASGLVLGGGSKKPDTAPTDTTTRSTATSTTAPTMGMPSPPAPRPT